MPPERQLSRIPASGRVVLIDAVEAQAEPGSIVCANLGDTKFGYFATHNIPLKLIPGLLEMGDDLLLVGIQPAHIEVGEELSPAVRSSVETLVGEIARTMGGRP